MYSTHTGQPQIRLVPQLPGAQFTPPLPLYVIRPGQTDLKSAFSIVLLSLSPYLDHNTHFGLDLDQFSPDSEENNPPLIKLLGELFHITPHHAISMLYHHISLISEAIGASTDGLYIIIDHYPSPGGENGQKNDKTDNNCDHAAPLATATLFKPGQTQVLLHILAYYQEIARLCDMGVPPSVIISAIFSSPHISNSQQPTIPTTSTSTISTPEFPQLETSTINFPTLLVELERYNQRVNMNNTDNNTRDNNNSPQIGEDDQADKNASTATASTATTTAAATTTTTTTAINPVVILPPRINYQIYTIPTMINFALPTIHHIFDQTQGVGGVGGVRGVGGVGGVNFDERNNNGNLHFTQNRTENQSNFLDFPLSRIICHIMRSMHLEHHSRQLKSSQNNFTNDQQHQPDNNDSGSNNNDNNNNHLTTLPISIFAHNLPSSIASLAFQTISQGQITKQKIDHISPHHSDHIWTQHYTTDPFLNLLLNHLPTIKTTNDDTFDITTAVTAAKTETTINYGDHHMITTDTHHKITNLSVSYQAPLLLSSANTQQLPQQLPQQPLIPPSSTNMTILDIDCIALHSFIHQLSTNQDQYIYPFHIISGTEIPPNNSKNSQFLQTNWVHLYNTCCIGGSFDHLHTGHHLLLLSAMILGQKSLILGVTAAKMLQKKAYLDQFEPWVMRVANVMSYCQIFKGICEFKVGLDESKNSLLPQTSAPASPPSIGTFNEHLKLIPVIDQQHNIVTNDQTTDDHTSISTTISTTIDQFKYTFSSSIVPKASTAISIPNIDQGYDKTPNQEEEEGEQSEEKNNQDLKKNSKPERPSSELPSSSQFTMIIEPLHDMYGPSIKYDEIECLILSDEVKKGGPMVNNERKKQNRPPSELFVVPLLILPQAQPELINDNIVYIPTSNSQLKVSSTDFRHFFETIKDKK